MILDPDLHAELLKGCLEDLEERIMLLQEVLVPDHLDATQRPDWDLLIEVRRLQRMLQTLTLYVSQRNRDMIVNGWVGGPPIGSPPGSDIGPGSGG